LFCLLRGITVSGFCKLVSVALAPHAPKRRFRERRSPALEAGSTPSTIAIASITPTAGAVRINNKVRLRYGAGVRKVWLRIESRKEFETERCN